MKLSDVATIRTNYPEADFWLVRRGSAKRCGEPERNFNPESIGIKVHKTDILLPKFLYYVLKNSHQNGYWERLVNGTLSLVNIRISDVRNIELMIR